MQMQIVKASALPAALGANTVYFIKDGAAGYKQYITDNAGTVTHSLSAPDMNRYDLPMVTTTGAMNLSANQVFKVDLSTAGARNVSFTNPPANTRSMVIVLKTTGSVGSIVFPSNVTFGDEVDATPGTVSSVFTILYSDGAYLLAGNIRSS